MDITVAQMWALGKWAYRLKGREVESIDDDIGPAEMPPEWLATQSWHAGRDGRPVFQVRDFDDVVGLGAEELVPVLTELCDRLLRLVTEDGDLDIRYYPGHAGRHSCPPDNEGVLGVLSGDWNNPLAAFISDLWEWRGGEIEWCDGGTECDGCHGFVQTQADHHGWQPQFVDLSDGTTLCAGCLADDEEAQRAVLDGYTNNARVAMQRQFALEPHGFTEVRDRADTGLHEGQNDDPAVVIRKIRAAGCGGDVVFQIDAVGQFDARWSVWYRPEDFDPACDDVDDLETDADLRDEIERARDAVSGDVSGRSPAAAMKAALRDAAKQEEAIGPAPPGFVRCVSTKNDGTADVRDIPYDEFIQGGFKRQ